MSGSGEMGASTDGDLMTTGSEVEPKKLAMAREEIGSLGKCSDLAFSARSARKKISGVLRCTQQLKLKKRRLN